MDVAFSGTPWLACATALYACACLHGVGAARRGRVEGRVSAAFLGLFAAAFLAQSVGLLALAVSPSPIFWRFALPQAVAWCAVALAFALRPFCAVALLRRFTAGAAAALCALSWAFWSLPPARPALGVWVSVHVGLAVFAYAVFALLAVCALLYLLQRRALRRKDADALAGTLPPLSRFDGVAGALLPAGVVLLGISLAIGCALQSHAAASPAKIACGALVWILFASLWAARRFAKLAPAKTAWCALACFVFAIAGLWAAGGAPTAEPSENAAAEVSGE